MPGYFLFHCVSCLLFNFYLYIPYQPDSTFPIASDISRNVSESSNRILYDQTTAKLKITKVCHTVICINPFDIVTVAETMKKDLCISESIFHPKTQHRTKIKKIQTAAKNSEPCYSKGDKLETISCDC